jgi:hypothetical protein
MLFQGQTLNSLPKTRVSGNPNAEQLWMGELAVSEVMPRYSALTKSGFMFSTRSPLVALSLAGAAMTGLIVWNSSPAGGTDMHLLKASGNVVATSATMTGIAIATFTGQINAPTTPTALAVRNNYLGGPTGVGQAYSGGTLVNTPVASFDVLHNTAAIAVSGEDNGFLVDLEGSYVLPPQTGACFVALGAASAAAAVNLSLLWAELTA